MLDQLTYRPFSDVPYCKPDQTQVFGVAREETVRISCEVVSNPVGSTSFEWRFNASDTGEMVDMPHDRFRSTNSKVLYYLSVSFPRESCASSAKDTRLLET